MNRRITLVAIIAAGLDLVALPAYAGNGDTGHGCPHSNGFICPPPHPTTTTTPTMPTSPTGPTGPTGATGPPGASGSPGVVGPTGPTGASGATGATGGNGANGAPGTVGPTGPQGVPGVTGAVGSPGPVVPYAAIFPQRRNRSKAGTTFHFQVDAVGASPILLAFWWRHVGTGKHGRWINENRSTSYGLNGTLPRLVSGAIFVPRGEAIKIRTAGPFSNVMVRRG